jgi:hypothetical protein
LKEKKAEEPMQEKITLKEMMKTGFAILFISKIMMR